MRARLTARARRAKALVSDERESYTPGAENAGLEHQLGLAHWRKAVARRRKPVEDYETEQQLFETALQRLDESGHRSLQWLHSQSRRARPPRKGERQSPEYALRMLTLDILEKASGIPLGGDGLPAGLEPTGLLSTGTRTAAR